MNRHTLNDLKQMQSLPLAAKIEMTRRRIREWMEEFGEDSVYISFSGGKDSTVLLDIVRKDYPNIIAVFVNTGLEYPTIRKFVLSFDNVIELRPIMNFRDVIIKYGYPIISKEVSQTLWEAQKSVRNGKNIPTYRLKKLNGEAVDKDGKPSQYNIPQWKFFLEAPFNISHKCCDIMKKNPAKKYEKENDSKGIIATMADESKLRQQKWIKNGCNAWNLKRPQSNPMSFWTEQDVLTYIHEYNLAIADAYGKVVVKDGIDGQMNIHDILGDYRECQYETTGCKRTGCVYCLMGIRQDLERIHRLQKDEPKMADYVLRGGEFNQDGIWIPSKTGIGYWFILDWLALHDIFIPYENAEYYRETYGNKKTRELLKSKSDF